MAPPLSPRNPATERETYSRIYDGVELENRRIPTSSGGNLEEPDANARIAAGKALSILMKMEMDGCVGLEKDSVYGAAVAVPQIARSAGWPKTMVGLSIRCYVFLLLNVCVQGFIISMIREEAEVMDSFAGQMHLCDFGARLDKCPDSLGCQGPGGTPISPPRLYGFSTWSTRLFVRDSLVKVFPEMADEIHNLVDPGEYGLESYGCRLVCCFLFMLAVVDDLNASLDLTKLFYSIPTRADAWITYEVPSWEEKENAKKVHGWCELDLVTFKVAGMPMFWKVVNLTTVVAPKIVLWFCLTSAGCHFLMETAGIVDVTVNAMAMTFILEIDEMILKCLATTATRYMLENMEDYALYDTQLEDAETYEQVLERFTRDEKLQPKSLLEKRFASLLFPRRLAFVVVLMAIFLTKYYLTHCHQHVDGSWVSNDMHLPKRVRYDSLTLLFKGVDNEQAPMWTMPSSA